MKKSMLAGAITGVGVVLALAAGMQKPILTWAHVGLLVGVTLFVTGMTLLCLELEGRPI